MKTIKRVTQFPLQAQPEGDIAYNINTKQLRVYKDDNGTFVDYDSFYVSPDVDALSVNGYYPLYRSESLSNAASPLGTSHPHNATDLGTAPAGIDYPLYMPNGLGTMYHGNYIDPLADDDSDGVPNFRDPAIVGLTALPSAGIKSGSPYTTPLHSGGSGGGVTIAAGDITNEINEPGSGSYNDTDKTITLNATGPGLLIKSDGSLNKFNQGDSVSIEPGDTFVYQGGMTGSGQSSLGNTGGDSANYSGSGNFTTNGGAVVDLEDALKAQNDGTIDAGTQNNTGSSITKPFSGTGILVDDAGNTTPVTSPATIPPGSTLFVKSGGKNDSLHWDGSTMPFTTPDGTSIDLTNHLTNDGSGTAYINNSGGTASVSWTGDGLLVSPQGAVTQVTSPYDVPAGWMIFTGTYESSSSGGDSSSGGGGSSSTGTPANLTPDGSGNVSVPNGSGGSTNVDLNAAFSGTGIGDFDGGTTNNTGGNITTTLNSDQVGVVIDGTGSVGPKQTGDITYGDGDTLVVKTIDVQTTGSGTPGSPLIISTYGGDPTSLATADGNTFKTDPLKGYMDEFFRYDFGSPTEVTELRLIDYKYSGGASALIIQSSNDGENWTGNMVGLDGTSASTPWPDATAAGEDILTFSVSPSIGVNQYVDSANAAILSNKIPAGSIAHSAQMTFTPFTARYVRIVIWQYSANGEFEVDQVEFVTSSGGSSTGTDAGYTGGDYSTGGGSVNVESELGGTSNGTIDGGTSNDGGSNISKTFDDTKQTAILVDDSTGVVTQVTGSPVTIPPGSTLFVKTTQLDPLTISFTATYSGAATFTVSGAAAGTAVKYQMATSNQFESSSIIADSILATNQGTTITNLTPSTTYFIRAYQYTDGLDPSNASEWSNIISSTTSAASGGGSGQDQTITFPLINDIDLSAGTIDFDGFATASSGLTVTYSVHPNDAGKASFSGTTLTLSSAGDVTILANQAGSTTYNAAPEVARVMHVTDISSQSGGSGVGVGDTSATELWTMGNQIVVSAGQWSGGFTTYGAYTGTATDHTDMPISLNMDSSAFTIGTSSADQVEYFLAIPTPGDSDGSANSIKVSYSKTYQINTDPTANTILTITLNSKQYTFDFNTAGNQSHSHSDRFILTAI